MAPKTVEVKDFRFELKELHDEGTFEGLLSVYDVLDLGGDIVEKGAFKKTLKDSGGRIPLLWSHKSDEPIGLLDLEDSDEALKVKGELLLSINRGRELYELLKAGVVKGLSIGYRTIKDEVKDGVRHLKELALHEGSLVMFPMNERALVTGVKSDEISDRVVSDLEDRLMFLRRSLARVKESGADIPPETQLVIAGAVRRLSGLIESAAADTSPKEADDTSKEAAVTPESEAVGTVERRALDALERLKADLSGATSA